MVREQVGTAPLPLNRGRDDFAYSALDCHRRLRQWPELAPRFRFWQFVPPELTLHIIRPPIGAWIFLDAVTDLQSEGLGLTTARLFDQRGQVARSAQSLFIARRAEMPFLPA